MCNYVLFEQWIVGATYRILPDKYVFLLNIKSCLKLKALAITIYMLKFLQIMML